MTTTHTAPIEGLAVCDDCGSTSYCTDTCGCPICKPEPWSPCDWCGADECEDDCECSTCESERALDDIAGAYFDRD
jgi:hypothetical protein